VNRCKFLSACLAACLLGVAVTAGAAQPLHLEVFNPGEKSVFPVSSEIISGEHEVVLIDAQFQRNDAEALVDIIKATGRHLTTVFVSHGDPDFYFGLDVIHAAFPDARILASAPTARRIAATREAKLAYWGSVLKDQVPHELITPQAIAADSLTVDGERIEIRGLEGPNPLRSYLWIPSLRTVLGGVTTVSGAHIWLADTPSEALRQAWLESLEDIAALHPSAVIPGHFLGKLPAGDDAVQFTAGYLRDFSAAAAGSANSAGVVAAMKAKYPEIGREAALEFSAKVIKGEVQWAP
jgi:glyoxylase-like metal-dependent hydrolase (beta-lactamase superfamily II)